MDTSLEVLALRQQVAVLKRKRPRPSLNRLDRFFWTTLRYIWPRWSDVLVIVKPETVVGWHRSGFRLYWRWRSRGGRHGCILSLSWEGKLEIPQNMRFFIVALAGAILPFAPAAETGKINAQKIVDEVLATHSEISALKLAAIRSDSEGCKMIAATEPYEIGKACEEDELTAMETNGPFVNEEMASSTLRCRSTIPTERLL